MFWNKFLMMSRFQTTGRFNHLQCLRVNYSLYNIPHNDTVF
eukprot:UN01186